MLDAPAEPSAEAAGALLHWPRINLLAYHFPMIADEGRNGAFDRALTSAIRRFQDAHDGRSPRVLDIGSGSGLLAMMAARAGASVVHSLEMVSSLAHAAKHIVASNGYAEVVTVHSVMSTDLDPQSVGGKFDILVCEIVDDLLLGESVLTTVADARQRLLTPSAAIVPRGGSIWALAVEMLPPSRAGLRLDSFQELAASTALSCNPNDSVKLQHHEGRYKRLAPPLELLSFDWGGKLSTLSRHTCGGESARLPLRIEASGTLTCLVVYFTLRCDGEPENLISTGPDSPNVAWDQCARHLPVPLHVREGEELGVVARHTDCYLTTLELSGFRASRLERDVVVGHPNLVGNPNARGLSVSMQPTG